MKLEDCDLSGYEPGTPRRRGLIDGAALDRETAEETPCPECGGPMEYRPFVNRDESSYRAFAVCTKCENAIEF